jgi:hypothetical protein
VKGRPQVRSPGPHTGKGGDEFVTSHDEPNEWGFAGQATAPEPARDTPEEAEEDKAEELAVPGTDVTTELSAALEDATGDDDELPDEAGSPPER